MNNAFQSEHFDLHTLAEGVYATIATEMGAGFSNAGLIDLGGQTLAFDAFENPRAAEDLLKASTQLTGRSPAVVIVSHWHPDHWAGLQVFAGGVILSTPAARQAMIPIAEEMMGEKRDPSRIEADIRETEARLADEIDPNKRHWLQAYITRQRHTLQALPTLVPILPNQTFEGKIVFYGARRSAELIATDKGHTESDCILKLPQDRVAFIGDLGFFQSQPFMPYSSPPDWLALLDDLAGWDIDAFVPGHGPVGSKADVALEARYIRALEDLVQRVVQAGGAVEDALGQTLSPPFDSWQVVGRRFEANVRASYERQRQQVDSSMKGDRSTG
jgi:glyoxylase-like metal-dependent hydrolase (beta-lactamase superfamily II)